MKRSFVLFLVLLIGGGMLFAGGGGQRGEAAASEDFRFERAITWIVPWAAGGTTDIQSRMLASLVEKELGTSIAVVNTVGGGGAVGFRTMIGARPDGYTVASVTPSMVLYRYTGVGMQDLPYDAADWVAIFSSLESVFTVPTNSPFQNMADLINFARANPEHVRISNSGIGAIWHAVAMAIEARTGVRFSHIPYEGGGPAAVAAAGGHVDVGACGVTEAFSLVQSGHLRILGMSGTQRLPALPNVPTFHEQGIEGIFGTFLGVGVPKGYPPAARAMLERAIIDSINSDEWINFAREGNISLNLIVGNEKDTFLSDLDRLFAQMF